MGLNYCNLLSRLIKLKPPWSSYPLFTNSQNLSVLLRCYSSQKEAIHVTYITKEGEKIVIEGKAGDNVMYLAHSNDIPIEGACEASLACCTCHVYVKDEFFDKLPTPDEREEDMLDMAPFLKPNSRLSCQIILANELDGIEVTLPPATRNFYVDGKKPTPH